MSQQPDVNKNIPSHANLGAGNEDTIFLIETTGKRRDLVASAISAISQDANNYSITSLMDYDSRRPNETSLQGTYCVIFLTNNKPKYLPERLIVRFKADMAEQATNLADRIFEHVENYIYSQGQGENLSVSRNITFSGKPSIIEQFHDTGEVNRILEMVNEFGQSFKQNTIICHGVMIDTNFMLSDTGIHIIDNETIAISEHPRGYDEGNAVFRALLDKVKNSTPEIDGNIMKIFLGEYNNYAAKEISFNDLAANINAYNINALFIGFAMCQEDEAMQKTGLGVIEICAQRMLDVENRIHAVLNLEGQKLSHERGLDL